MADVHIAPNDRSINTAISSCIKAGKVQAGFEILTSSRQERLHLDEVTLCTLLQAYQDKGQWESALFLLSRMPRMLIEPTEFHFAGAMASCAASGQWEWAVCLLGGMQEQEVLPDEVCYNAVLGACDEGKEWELALQVFNSMFLRKLLPNQRSFTAAISACGTCQQWESALALFHAMPAPNIIHWNAAISSSAQSAWPVAFALFDRMIRESISPDLDTMGSAMRLYQTAGHWQAALHLFTSMRGMSIVPDMDSYSDAYNYALDALHSSSCAVDLWKQAVKEGMFPRLLRRGPGQKGSKG